MRPVVFGEFQKAWTSYREITCWFDGKYRRDNIETKNDKDQAGNYGSFIETSPNAGCMYICNHVEERYPPKPDSHEAENQKSGF